MVRPGYFPSRAREEVVVVAFMSGALPMEIYCSERKVEIAMEVCGADDSPAYLQYRSLCRFAVRPARTGENWPSLPANRTKK
jgi:hypothetical protein